jgi:glucosamine kinase
MQIYLGIDGGGTHTRAVLVSEHGRLLGQGKAGPSNYHNVGLDRSVEHIMAATSAAVLTAGLTGHPVSSAFLGCAGIKSALDKTRLTLACETAGVAPPGEITVANDLLNALTGGLAGRPGIALIAGTGSHSLGRNAEGRTASCGGWGWLLDDVGGGFGLTLSALRAVARAVDGRSPKTRLLPAVLAFLQIAEPEELLARLYVDSWTPGELAEFAPVIKRLAAEGDAVANRILREGAKGLAGLVQSVANTLSFEVPPEVVVLGGCALSGTPYQPMIEESIRQACPRARIVDPEHSPVHGAAWNALRAGGIDPLPPLGGNLI